MLVQVVIPVLISFVVPVGVFFIGEVAERVVLICVLLIAPQAGCPGQPVQCIVRMRQVKLVLAAGAGARLMRDVALRVILVDKPVSVIFINLIEY